jgi:hypothetical protein
MTRNQREAKRVEFYPGYKVCIGDDQGTWSLPMLLADVSSTGAKLALLGADASAMAADTFTLFLTENRSASRACRLIWRRGKTLGVQFVRAH